MKTLAYIEHRGVKYYVWHGPRGGLRRKVRDRIESLGLGEDVIDRVRYEPFTGIDREMRYLEELD